MACSILEITYSKFISDADGNLIRAVLLCDTSAELPGNTYFSGYTLIQGSTCHVIDDNQDYMLDSGGTWYPYGGEMWQNVYTKTESDTLLAVKQNLLDVAQLAAVNSGITAAKLTTDEAALSEVVNNGAKNICNWTANTSTISGVTFTINDDKTVSTSGTATERSQKALTFTVPSTLKAGRYVISGCPSGGEQSGTILYCLYIWDNTDNIRVSSNDTGNGREFDWIPDASHTYTMAVDVRSGSNVTGLIFKPMICTAADWAVSQEFVNYCPSMQEMYKMILDLQ